MLTIQLISSKKGNWNLASRSLLPLSESSKAASKGLQTSLEPSCTFTQPLNSHNSTKRSSQLEST